jgi:hypothetical protein
MYIKTFPYKADIDSTFKGNPAIQLYGNRYSSDQSTLELLSEFLLIINAEKKIDSEKFSSALPPDQILDKWNDTMLQYAPKSRLNLKLFSFLGSSRLDSRHHTHLEQYNRLLNELKGKINTEGKANKQEVIRALENLFLGFQGIGTGRTWCAQSFFPFSKGFLTGETIWKETKAKRERPKSWDALFSSNSTFFTTNQHVFFARGGEVLYLYMCNALMRSEDDIRDWSEKYQIELNQNEQNPKWLHRELEKELSNLMSQCPKMVDEIADFIDRGIEAETSNKTDGYMGSPRYANAGWCPENAWQEGYLFALDILRICQADIDLIEKIYYLESACVLNVLRNMAKQSQRALSTGILADKLNYYFVISAPDEKNTALKRISQQSLQTIEKMVFSAIRLQMENVEKNNKSDESILREADKRSGPKFFLKLAKQAGLVIPRKGSGARFVLNSHLLRLLVLTTVPVQGRITYDKFKQLVKARYGMVFDASGFREASTWMDGNSIYLSSDTDAWLLEMLEASGLLIHLSDSCALVLHPNQENEEY